MLIQSILHEVVPFRIRASSVGPRGKLTLPNLVRLFQEAAMLNTVRLNISSPVLMADYGISWVLRQQRIDVQRWPEMGEMVDIITAPTGFARRLLTYRDFYLRDAAGNTIASAASEWLLIDVNSRRLQPIPPHIALLEKDLARFDKLSAAPAAAHLKRPSDKLAIPPSPTLSTEYQVAYHDLDFNDHLTNPVFPQLMLEPLGHDFLSGHEPTRIAIVFQKEARYGDQLTATTGTGDAPLRYDHALLRSGETLAIMRTDWRATGG
jgi:acyl-ACP thioesterase